MIKVSTITYNELNTKYLSLVIPEYQRAYSWNNEKIDDLLQDFTEFFIDNPKPNLTYYMGSVLLYKNKETNNYEIIDGQQRITTLTLIQYILNGKLQENQNLQYNSHISFYNIQNVVQYLANKEQLLNTLSKLDFLSKLTLTIIESDSEDNAFTFFDTQNNIGVSLAVDDYLKAYHLRALKSEEMQADYAQHWEQIAFNSQDRNFETSLLFLFRKILYRAREWRGRNVIQENKKIILKEFQKHTYISENNGYNLFINRNNLKYSKVIIKPDDTTTLVSFENLDTNTKYNMPFSLRQPIYKGLNFFQFTQKYYEIHQLLFHTNNADNTTLKKVSNFYIAIYTNKMSVYLRHYIQLCMVLYFDTFGKENLYKAIQYFDYFIGSLRISKKYVRKESVFNLMKDNKLNLLDVIAQAYFTEDVFRFIKTNNEVKNVYLKENIKEESNGVRIAYKLRLKKYYSKEDSKVNLKNRLEWI